MRRSSATAPCVALGLCSRQDSTASILGGVPPVTHMDVGNAKAMLEHRWPSMQSCALCARGIRTSPCVTQISANECSFFCSIAVRLKLRN